MNAVTKNKAGRKHEENDYFRQGDEGRPFENETFPEI